jgi:hypothetical protein
LKRTLDNANLFGKDDYPTSIEDGLQMMENHKPSQGWKGHQHHAQAQTTGVTFVQPGQGGRQGKGRDISKDKCFSCRTVGHHAKDCPGVSNQEKTGTDFFNVKDEAEHLEADL